MDEKTKVKLPESLQIFPDLIFYKNDAHLYSQLRGSPHLVPVDWDHVAKYDVSYMEDFATSIDEECGTTFLAKLKDARRRLAAEIHEEQRKIIGLIT